MSEHIDLGQLHNVLSLESKLIKMKMRGIIFSMNDKKKNPSLIFVMEYTKV